MPVKTQEFTLRAMAANYAVNESMIWDNLDKQALLEAADEIKNLRDEIAHLKEALGPKDTHPDSLAVTRFAGMMKEKMAVSRLRGRNGWEKCSIPLLSTMLREHVDKGDPVDVANLAMMIELNGGRIL